MIFNSWQLHSFVNMMKVRVMLMHDDIRFGVIKRDGQILMAAGDWATEDAARDGHRQFFPDRQSACDFIAKRYSDVAIRGMGIRVVPQR
jgi:hypothetical protein